MKYRNNVFDIITHIQYIIHIIYVYFSSYKAVT
nr:MAG TPA: hypothetical protein [Caudoviricetes sp.]